VALVDPEAMNALVRGTNRMLGEHWSAALEELATAESLQSDPRARVFLGTAISKRAVSLLELGRRDEAVREAQRSLARWPHILDARYVLARVAFERGRLDEAEARLDTLLRVAPRHREVLDLLGRVRSARRVAR
jgi:tetratricopeptide (TPR) repeat protein